MAPAETDQRCPRIVPRVFHEMPSCDVNTAIELRALRVRLLRSPTNTNWCFSQITSSTQNDWPSRSLGDRAPGRQCWQSRDWSRTGTKVACRKLGVQYWSLQAMRIPDDRTATEGNVRCRIA